MLHQLISIRSPTLSSPEYQVKHDNQNNSAKAYIHFFRFKFDRDKNVPKTQMIQYNPTARNIAGRSGIVFPNRLPVSQIGNYHDVVRQLFRGGMKFEWT
jgi:hypothetical protein